MIHSPPALSTEAQRKPSIVPTIRVDQRKGIQETASLGRRTSSIGPNQLFNTLRHRMSPKSSISAASTQEVDSNVSFPLNINLSPKTSCAPISSSIPINLSTKRTSIDYLSRSFLSPTNGNETARTNNPEFIIPVTAPPKQLWVSDRETSVCMCCNETQFSMFNRRHHCRRCGRVVCKPCSQHVTVIKERLERTCKDCYQQMQTNPTPAAIHITRPQPVANIKRAERVPA
jgi:hypothetical protein